MTDHGRADRRRVEELFQQSLDLPHHQRAAFLADNCPDPALRAGVERLLHIHEQGLADNLKTPVFFAPESSPETDAVVPPRIGRYEVIRKIGEGGMGVVYLARQDHPRRDVALKVMQPGLSSRSLLARFQHEADLLGRLKHPGIAQVYEGGAARVAMPHGEVDCPFFAMEFIEGEPLADYVRKRALKNRERLELVARVCDAIEHAHRQGVIHRDLKPANILVLPDERCGLPKVLDFGIARATDVDIQTVTLRTDVGQVVGTVPYMSPEQVMGDVRQLDARADVYSLGVILYELLAGRLPHNVHHRPIPEAVRIIQEEEPTRLSSISPEFRGDVDTIVAKALAKEKNNRYPSAAALAADIRRYLRDEPIVARRTSTFYQLRKFAKRNKALVGGVSLTMLLLVILAIQQTFARQNAERLAYHSGMAAAAAALRASNCVVARRHLEQVPQNLRGWEWRHFHAQLDDSVAKFETGAAAIHPIGFAQDNDLLLALTVDGAANPRLRPHEVLLLDLSENRIAARRVVQALEVLIGLDPDPERIVYFGADFTAYAESATTGESRLALGAVAADSDGWITARPVAWSADGRRILWFEQDRMVVVDSNGGERRILEEKKPRGHHRSAAISADGAKIAYSAGALGSIEVLVRDVDSDQLVYQGRGHKDSIQKMAFHPQGTSLVSVSSDYTIRHWPLDESHSASWEVITGHTDRVLSVGFSPDGSRIATVSRDRTVRLWDARSGQALSVFLGHEDEVQTLVFSPDGSRLASGGLKGTLRVWDVRLQGDPRTLRGHSSYVYPVAVSPDGSRIASGGWDGTLRLWDAASGEEIASLPMDRGGPYSIVESLAYDPRGELIAVCDRTSTWPTTFRLRTIDAWTGDEIGAFESPGNSCRVTFHPHGSKIAVCGATAPGLILLDRETLKDGARAKGQGFCAFSPDGDYLATGDGSAMLIYETESLKLAATLSRRKEQVDLGCFSPDSQRIVMAQDHTLSVWDWASGKELAELCGHTDQIYAVVFSPDGSRIVSGSNDRTIRLWDAQTFDEIVQLTGHTDYVYSLAFSPEGRWLVSGSGDFTVRIWETDPLPVRIQAQRDWRATMTQAGPVVDSLLSRFGTPSRVAAELRADPMLTPRFREIALQNLLRRNQPQQPNSETP